MAKENEIGNLRAILLFWMAQIVFCILQKHYNNFNTLTNNITAFNTIIREEQLVVLIVFYRNYSKMSDVIYPTLKQ